MTYYVGSRPGSTPRLRSLGQMLREQHEHRRAQVLAERAHREERDVPLDDREPGSSGPGPLEDSGPYDGDASLDGVLVALRVVPYASLQEIELEIVGERPTEDRRAIVQADLRLRAVMRELVAAAVVRVEGLEDDAGPCTMPARESLSQDELDALETAGLLLPLFSVARAYQYLTGERRKNFGGPRPSTSGTSSAPTARPISATSEGVMVVVGGTSPTAPISPATPAPDGVSCVTPSWVHGLSFTGTPRDA